MKKTFILLSFFFFSQKNWAQSPFEISINKLKTETQANITLDRSSGNANFIRFPKDNPLSLSGKSLIEKVNAFFDQYEGVFIDSDDASHWIEKEFNINPILQSQHITLVQHQNGVPVYGSELKFHFDTEMRITSINGFVYPNIPSHSEARLTIEHAKELAISFVEFKYSDISNVPLSIHSIDLFHYREGTIQNRPSGRDYLVFYAEVSNKSNIREFIFIDAITGKKLESFSGICQAINRSLYDGNLDTLVWQEGDAFPEDLDEWRQRELIASEDTYNFFKNTFAYTSFDGNDTEMIIVHDPDGMQCPNANWNGISINFCPGVGSDDVVAHEWGHAYTRFTSGLIYAWQSGALNEAYSDIWGETIDLLNNFDDEDEDLSLRTDCGNSQRWLTGEDAVAFDGAIRDLWNPNCFSDPASVSDNQYYSCQNLDEDNGGVHTNSGVINHSYSLLTDGGSFNNTTIASLGMTKTAHIYWRAQSIYLNPTSDFANFADALEASCSDLIGINLEGLSTELPVGLSGEMIDSMDCQAIAHMIEILELRIEPDCNFTTILDHNPPNLDCMDFDSIFYQDFEMGMDGWTPSAEPSNPDSWDFREWTITNDLPQGNAGSAVFVPNPIIGNCADDLENGIVRLESPLIELPTTEDVRYHLMFRHYIATEPLWDGGNLKYSKDGGQEWHLIDSSSFIYNGYNTKLRPIDQNNNPMASQFAFTGTDDGSNIGSWGESHVNLKAMGLNPGDNIIIRWELGEDGCNGRLGWYLDDVLIYTCFDNSPPVTNENIISESDIKIAPNPFQDYISIDIKKNIGGNNDIRIINLSGKVVFSKQAQFNTNTALVLEELEYLPVGIYIVHIQGKDAVYTGKVVKI